MAARRVYPLPQGCTELFSDIIAVVHVNPPPWDSTQFFPDLSGFLFSISKRLLIENKKPVPDELRSARFRLARKMGNKIGQKLLMTRFPREDSKTQ